MSLTTVAEAPAAGAHCEGRAHVVNFLSVLGQQVRLPSLATHIGREGDTGSVQPYPRIMRLSIIKLGPPISSTKTYLTWYTARPRVSKEMFTYNILTTGEPLKHRVA